MDDPAPDAYERLVDRLLASPHFGERWGRHWLDVVRFAESLTLRGLRPQATPGITAITSSTPSTPIGRTTASSSEQIAGDLLPGRASADRREQLIATTFLTLGNTNLEEQDKAQLEMDVVDEQLDTIGKAFLARPSAAPAATTTSSTRSRPAITMRWPGSSATRRPWNTPTSPDGWRSRCPSPPSRRPRSVGTRPRSPISNRASRRPAHGRRRTRVRLLGRRTGRSPRWSPA